MAVWDSRGNQKKVSVAGVVLAAGKGTRMKSQTTKVLHEVMGKSILSLVLKALRGAEVNDIVIVINNEQRTDETFMAEVANSIICLQELPRGTADAVASAAPAFSATRDPRYSSGQMIRGNIINADYVLICAGDTPCLQSSSLREFIGSALGADLTVLATEQEDPTGYGRLVTQGEDLLGIIEEKDCSASQKAIRLVNSGIYLVRTELLFRLLGEIEPNNAQNEYYLTDIVKIARATNRGYLVQWKTAGESAEYSGVNDREQLAIAEKYLSTRYKRTLMQQGVTLRLPDTIYIDSSVSIGSDTEIGSGSSILGASFIGKNSRIGHHVVLRDVILGNGCFIGDFTFMEAVTLKDGEVIAPGTIKKRK